MTDKDKSIIKDMQNSMHFDADPSTKVDSRLHDLDGNLVDVGNDDPNVIGLDSKPTFSYRPLAAYPDHPKQIVEAEHSYVLPLAKFVADSLGIVPIDEHAYTKVLDAVQSRSILVILNQRGLTVEDNVATWFGLVIMCRRHPVAMVQFKIQLSTNKIGISQIRLWRSREKRYHIQGDRDARKFIPRPEATAMLLNYIKEEGIVNI